MYNKPKLGTYSRLLLKRKGFLFNSSGFHNVSTFTLVKNQTVVVPYFQYRKNGKKSLPIFFRLL